jgi:hypothetical protein
MAVNNNELYYPPSGSEIMIPKTDTHFLTILVLIAILGGVFSGCTPIRTAVPASPLPDTIAPTQFNLPSATALSVPTLIPVPIISLKEGDFYFNIDAQQSFIFSRNVAGYETSQYYQLLDLTSIGGSKFVRIQLDGLGMGYSNTGKVDESWAGKWEDIFEKAASNGIYVMPVFGVWYDWNDGNGYSTWGSNPFNEINGGPAKTSAELFISDSPTQKLWLGWMKTLIERWQGQKNLIAWEIFSEVNMAPGTTEPEAIDFVNKVASVIDNADSFHRPLTTSLADFGDWSDFYSNDSIDFINIHPYPVSGNLDTTIIAEVRSMLAEYRKPVFIGESGLSFLTPDTNPPTLTTADRADIGIKHAIWAAVVSGAMNGRALWWEDGVAIYFPALNMPFIQKYADAELPASNFVREVDFSDFQPLTSISDSGVWGAAVGNEKIALGWYRDATSEPPDWNLQPVVSKQAVVLTVPGSASIWKVDFYNTKDGTTVQSSASFTRQGNSITILLPDFNDDIAFKMTAQTGTASTAAPAIVTTDPIAGTWSGTISDLAGTFTTSLELSITAGCMPGKVCGTFSVPQVPCTGDLFLHAINAATFLFLEQNVFGAASCISVGYEQLLLLPNGTLSFEYLTTPGSTATSTGNLKKP